MKKFTKWNWTLNIWVSSVQMVLMLNVRIYKRYLSKPDQWAELCYSIDWNKSIMQHDAIFDHWKQFTNSCRKLPMQCLQHHMVMRVKFLWNNELTSPGLIHEAHEAMDEEMPLRSHSLDDRKVCNLQVEAKRPIAGSGAGPNSLRVIAMKREIP